MRFVRFLGALLIALIAFVLGALAASARALWSAGGRCGRARWHGMAGAKLWPQRGDALR